MANFASMPGWLSRSKGKIAPERGNPPHLTAGSIALVSCDAHYLREHALTLVNSISANSPDVRIHLHVVHPCAEFAAILEFLRCRVRCTVRCSTENPPLESWPVEARRTYYACSRFRVAADLMADEPANYFILDADSLVRRALRPPAADFGFMLRDNNRSLWKKTPRHLRASAGLVYAAPTSHGKDFLRDVQRRVLDLTRPGDFRWYLDQIALWRAYCRGVRRGADFFSFEKKDLDWDFHEDSVIWTAKGDRKASSTYLREAEKYRLRFEASREDRLR